MSLARAPSANVVMGCPSRTSSMARYGSDAAVGGSGSIPASYRRDAFVLELHEGLHLGERARASSRVVNRSAGWISFTATSRVVWRSCC